MNEPLQQENIITKVLDKVKMNRSEIVLSIAVVLITIISFNLGKISAISGQKAQIKITGGENAKQAGSAEGVPALGTAPAKDQTVVASKNSKGKLYHFAWCPGASMIAEKNRITFANEAAAIAAGYTLAGNCRK